MDYSSRKLQVISRSAFAAELKSKREAAKEAIKYAELLHEICFGCLTAAECTRMRDVAAHSLYIPVHVCGDSHLLYPSVIKEDPSPDSDPIMCYHVKAMRELLYNHSIESIVWVDTRDLHADGLARGWITRSHLNDALSAGLWLLEQKHEV